MPRPYRVSLFVNLRGRVVEIELNDVLSCLQGVSRQGYVKLLAAQWCLMHTDVGLYIPGYLCRQKRHVPYSLETFPR